MISLFNQYSLVFIGAAVALLASLILRTVFRFQWRGILVAELLIIVAFTGSFLLLRTSVGDVNSVASADALLKNNRPTFVELFSNFCTGCLLVRPSVDRLVDQIEEDFNIIRVNIHAPVGREMRNRFDFTLSPEFILFDSNGVEVWRGHTPPSEKELELARQS